MDNLPKKKLLKMLYEQWEAEKITRIQLEEKDRQICMHSIDCHDMSVKAFKIKRLFF